MGDFNEILSHDENVGSGIQRQGPIDDFRDRVSHCGLLDLGFRGCPYTWCNK